MRIPLLSGAYQARSLIASAQRCVNLYPEINSDEQAPVPVTHYPTPGLTVLTNPPARIGKTRGLYRATNGDLYSVIGPEVFYIDSDFTHTSIGTIEDGQTPTSMADNGIEIVLVDGTAAGYSIDMGTRVMTPISDVNFYGGTRVQYIDTFFAINRPNTNQWYLSDSLAVTFDPLYLVAKSGGADNLVSIVALRRELWLIGELTTEIWSNTGAPDFPFQELQGTFIEHGCSAAYSVAAQDASVFWLSQDREGNGIIIRTKGYEAQRISTHAIEAEIQAYSRIDDAIGFCYQIQGHSFYDITFPTADVTWSYELKSGQWHQKAYVDVNGTLRRHRANCSAFAYGKNVVGDWQNGYLYHFDPNNYTDAGNPIVRIRTFPHMIENDDRVVHSSFTADLEPGEYEGDEDPVVRLRWSDTRGKSYGNSVEQSMGSGGEYLKSIQWNRLGLARDRVYELSWSVAAKTSLNGAFLELKKSAT